MNFDSVRPRKHVSSKYTGTTKEIMNNSNKNENSGGYHSERSASRRSELAPRLKRRSRRRTHHARDRSNNDNNEGDGPSLITMLFVAVALATIFNMSRNSATPDPYTVAYKNGNALRGGVGAGDEAMLRYQAQQQVTAGYGTPVMNGSPGYAMTGQTAHYTSTNPAVIAPQPIHAISGWGGQQNIAIQMTPEQLQQLQLQQQGGYTNPAQQQQPTLDQIVDGSANDLYNQGGFAVSHEQDKILEEKWALNGGGKGEKEGLPLAGPPSDGSMPPPAEGEAPTPGLMLGAVVNPVLEGYKDNWDPIEPSDQPVFWHIPKAGGSTVKDIMGTCHRFTMASEYGIVEGHDQDTEIAVVRPGGAPVDQDPSPFVNVDPTTLHGIDRCVELGLAESGFADCIVTPWIIESDKIFTPNARGRFFTVFRHPVDRVISLFFYLQVADWEPTFNPDLANMSLEEYAASPLIENNWMTRQLTSSFEGDLTDAHAIVAKDIIRRKFLVGLLHEKERTMDRFEKFFAWKYRVNPENQEKCRENLLSSGANSNSANKKEKPKPGDSGYDAVAWQNNYDIQLYEYIEQLFEEQEELVKSVPDGFRMMDASCSKCVPPTFPTHVAGQIVMSGPAPLPPSDERGLPPPPPADLPQQQADAGAGASIASSVQAVPAVLPVLDGYKDTSEPPEETDSPVFWHIPKAGGSTVKDIMGTCHRFTMASEYGIVEGHDQDTVISVVRPGGVPVDQDPSPFVNVDPTTLPGIDRCVELGLAESGFADCIVTPWIGESNKIFSPGHRGRLFTVFRHPVDRVISLFFYLQVADWEPTFNPDLANMSLEEYAASPLIENNWMTRQLTSAFEGDLTDQHLEVAKEIVGKKFLVGLLHEKERTMDRVEKFFRWKYRVNPENQEKCRENLLSSGANSNASNKKEKPKPGDSGYDAVALQNNYDIPLYEYIEQLFEEQEELVKSVPDGFRMMDASCSKCVPPTFPSQIL